MKEMSQNKILFGKQKILIKESALNSLEALLKEKRKQRILMANKVKTMYKNAVFRKKARITFQRNAILKGYMMEMLGSIRQRILRKKVVKIQNLIRKTLLRIRFEKIKEEATKSVTTISAFWKMKKQRRIFLKIKHNTVRIQSVIRAYRSMGQFFRIRDCQKIFK